jgi:streptomycin 6-kinase
LIADGIGGQVYRVEREDGSSAIVKQPSALAVRDGDAVTGADFLLWRDGHGAVRLLDRAGHLQLLEDVGNHTLLSVFESEGDDAATVIATDVIRMLHTPAEAAAPVSVPGLRENFRSLFTKASADLKAAEDSQFVEAARIAERLLANQTDVRPLHGDIHHENIMKGSRGWVAIDAKGLLGDPAFDIANLFYNPVESELRTDERRVMSMAALLSARLGYHAGKLLDYAFAFSALSASWHIEDGNKEEAERSLAVGRAVRAVGSALSD